MKKIFNLSMFYLIFGLCLGVFYREFTKFNNFTGKTFLSLLHTHLLVLGFIFFLIILLLDKNFNITSAKNFNKWLITYNVGLLYLVAMFLVRGILQVFGQELDGLNHISGLGHAILGISLIWFVFILKGSINTYLNKKS